MKRSKPGWVFHPAFLYFRFFYYDFQNLVCHANIWCYAINYAQLSTNFTHHFETR